MSCIGHTCIARSNYMYSTPVAQARLGIRLPCCLGGLSTAVSPNTPAGERGAAVALALAVATATVVAFFLRTTCRRTCQLLLRKVRAGRYRQRNQPVHASTSCSDQARHWPFLCPNSHARMRDRWPVRTLPRSPRAGSRAACCRRPPRLPARTIRRHCTQEPPPVSVACGFKENSTFVMSWACAMALAEISKPSRG